MLAAYPACQYSGYFEATAAAPIPANGPFLLVCAANSISERVNNRSSGKLA